jgi:hypothetical protein
MRWLWRSWGGVRWLGDGAEVMPGLGRECNSRGVASIDRRLSLKGRRSGLNLGSSLTLAWSCLVRSALSHLATWRYLGPIEVLGFLGRGAYRCRSANGL